MTTNIDDFDRGAVLATISEEAFPNARACISGLDKYADYEDWLDCRQGVQMGLAMAGVEVRTIPIEIALFIDWCRETRTRPSEASLDIFAAQQCHDLSPVRIH